MARIGALSLGGRGIGCGVSFNLFEPAKFSYLFSPAAEDWKVEIISGQSSIVARTTLNMNRSDLLEQGLEQVQRCLDLVSFELRHHLQLKQPGDNHIAVFERGAILIAEHLDISALEYKSNFKVIITDKDGNVQPATTPPPSEWTPALRYYRNSQSSTELNDAYRCLWLGLETILGTICVKQNGEREINWLQRSLTQVASLIDLKPMVPSSITDPVAYILGTQYKFIRCRLFHADISQPAAPPNVPTPEEVAKAYEQLIRLWRFIAERVFKVHGGASGIMTYVGFKLLLDGVYKDKLSMYFTDDPSPAKSEDTVVSPLGHAVHSFMQVNYLSEIAPGRVGFFGTQHVAGARADLAVHRIAAKSNDDLMTLSSIENGLYLDGVDIFESHQTVRLINSDLPRTIFGE